MATIATGNNTNHHIKRNAKREGIPASTTPNCLLVPAPYEAAHETILTSLFPGQWYA